MTTRQTGFTLVAVGVLLTALLLAGFLRAGEQIPDSLRDRSLENTLILHGVSDSTIMDIMWMRQNSFIGDDGQPQDNDYFYLAPNGRRGWIVTVKDGCVEKIKEVFDRDKGPKR